MTTTPENIAELGELFQDTERRIRKTRRRAVLLVRQIIDRGDAAALTQLQQAEIQAAIPAILAGAEMQVLQLHGQLVDLAALAGLEVPGPLTGDDDISINSSGGR